MKRVAFFILSIIALALSSCTNDDEPSYIWEGSPRDWTYTKEQISFFVDNVEQPSVSEITVRSIILDATSDEFPLYEQTLSVKGLLPNHKIFDIKVDADIDRFEGSTNYNNIEYNVAGFYTGNPFEHYKDMRIKVYLEKK
ncbi:MAG: hypothetical protein K2H38_04990 [Muribaculaceae bacterium]|nr:hypothetical protein [Muribaculaceae bacterium]MDE6554162.1 hypothetical protein [Muribaculaceae bacterium]